MKTYEKRYANRYCIKSGMPTCTIMNWEKAGKIPKAGRDFMNGSRIVSIGGFK
jgi:hypothetical protein